jgi:Universal stress protein family.
MRHILTCTDGSPYARSIYELTAWAAERLDAAVHVLHMLDPHRERAENIDLSGNIGLDTSQTLLHELVDLEEKQNRLAREQGKLVLAEAERQLRAGGVSRLTLEQRHGELVETVTRLEEKPTSSFWASAAKTPASPPTTSARIWNASSGPASVRFLSPRASFRP